MNVVDSSAWLAYFADEENAELFSEPIEDVKTLLVPVICCYEVFRVVLRESGQNKAFQAIAAMQHGQVINLDFELSLEAATLGLKEGLPMADSIIYAIAIRYGAVLWTQDEHFENKPLVKYYRK
jgi:toxin FitB